jgi:trehalose/maltose hydrolase-like predicted phosphorylase
MRNWLINYTDWKPDEQPLREAICTLGNGYFATRGAAEESPENEYNYPGTYLAGGYNRLKSKIAGKEIENEDLVNWPNWLLLTFRHKDGEWLNLNKVKIYEYRQVLNLKKGILERKMRFCDSKNRETTLLTRRIVSMHDPHVAGIEWILKPENWSGEIIIRSGIDGSVTNDGVARYRDLNGNHLEINDKGIINNNDFYLLSVTKQSKMQVAQAVRTIVSMNGNENPGKRKNIQKDQYVGQEIQVQCEKRKPVNIEKLVTIYTSKDFAISDPLTETKSKLSRLENFKSLLEKHVVTWSQIWDKSDLDLLTGSQNQLILRLHIFHLYQTASHNSIDLDIGVPSRGWHGEAYRGHIFWDELYIFPYINLHNPQLARSLLMYRYRRLPEAQQAAKEAGYRGAMYPWQSGSNGQEESQEIHLNPKSGRWIPDHSSLQRHINGAIPYNVWQYYQCTKDMGFLTYYGAEIIFNTALFWSSIAEYNPERERYEIRGVVGPDEYHTQYPGVDTPGLNNNAYTNFMAVWVLRCALNLLDMFDKDVQEEFFAKVGFNQYDIEKWEDIIQKMYIPFYDGDIIMQFEGFEQLKDLDWPTYRGKYGDTIRLDRILEKENDSPNNYKACKQADVLMLFYLFSSEELVKIFDQLGYEFDPESIPKNIEYYQEITSHGSTLSQVIHSWVYTRSDRQRSWKSFEEALMSDFKDVQGGTTPEGIHLGAMAGTIDLIQRCYTGLEIRDDVLWFNPQLPEDIKTLSFYVRYRSHWIKLDIDTDKLKINFDKGWADPVEIGVKGKKFRFETDDSKEFDL